MSADETGNVLYYGDNLDILGGSAEATGST